MLLLLRAVITFVACSPTYFLLLCRQKRGSGAPALAPRKALKIHSSSSTGEVERASSEAATERAEAERPTAQAMSSEVVILPPVGGLADVYTSEAAQPTEGATGAGLAAVRPDEPAVGHEAVVREAAEAASVVEMAVVPRVEAVVVGEAAQA